MALLLAAIAVAGFWPSYWGPLLAGTLDLHWLLHVHGLVFTAWMGLLVVQTVLVFRGRADLHQKVGTYLGMGLGVLVIVVGLSAIFGTISPAIGTEYEDLQGFVSAVLAINLPGMVAFAVLFGAGIAYRTRPAIHKRLMLVATLTLLSAATFRLGINVLGLSFWRSTVVGRSLPLLLAGVAVGYDRWSRGCVHPVYWAAIGVLVLDDGMALLTPTEAWTTLTAEIAEALRAVLRPLI